MKQKKLQTRLLVAIIALCSAAVILCVVSFSVMLGNTAEEALARGREMNAVLLSAVLDGFAQNEGSSMLGITGHIMLALREHETADDEEFISFAADEYYSIITVVDEWMRPDTVIFVARGGSVTAAVYCAYDRRSVLSVAGAEDILMASGLTKAVYGIEDMPLKEYLTPKYATNANYDAYNPDIPLLFMVPLGSDDVFGLFMPQANSAGALSSMEEFSQLMYDETDFAMRAVARKYTITLAAVAVALLAVIAIIGFRLSRALAEPVEREKEMLERVNRLKTEFLADISHELKTPLTVMSGYAQHGQKTLRDIPEAEDAERGMKLIASEADRLALMVSQVLDITRIDEERMSFSMQPNSIPALIQRTLDIYYPVFSKNDNTLRVVPAALPPVICDDQRIMQVVVNLIANAAKHTRDGEITVRPEQDGGLIRVTVSDTGDGIPPEKMAKLFERYREKAGPDDTGTGLGLPICKYIIEAHGGILEITSELGAGTNASFTLPLAE